MDEPHCSRIRVRTHSWQGVETGSKESKCGGEEHIGPRRRGHLDVSDREREDEKNRYR